MNARRDDSSDALSALFGGLADTAPAPVTSEDDGIDDRWPEAPRPDAHRPDVMRPDVMPSGPAPTDGRFDPASFGAPRSASGSPSAGDLAAPLPGSAFPPAPPVSAPAFPPAAASFPPPAPAAAAAPPQPNSTPGVPAQPPTAAQQPPSGNSPTAAAPPASAVPVYRPEHPTFPPAPVTPAGYPATAPFPTTPPAPAGGTPAAATTFPGAPAASPSAPPTSGLPASAPPISGPPTSAPSTPAPAATPPNAAAPPTWPADPQERLYVPPQYAPTEPWSPDRDALDAPSWAPPPPQAGPIPIITSEGMPTSRRALREQAEAAAAAQPPPLVAPADPERPVTSTMPGAAAATPVPPAAAESARVTPAPPAVDPPRSEPPVAPAVAPTPVSHESSAPPPVLPSTTIFERPIERPVDPQPAAMPQRPADPRSVAVPPAQTSGGGRPPTGPLLPDAPPIERVSVEELERPTGTDWLGLVLSLLVPLGGLAVAIANAVRSSRRRGWVIGVVRASLVAGTITTVLGGLGAAAGVVLENQAREHDRIAAESAAFCSAFAEAPDLLASPTLGWPAPAASIPESLAGMQDYAARMTALAATAPEGVRGGLVQIVSAASERIAEVSRVRSVDAAAGEAAISAAVSASGVTAWHAEYCAG